MSRTMTVLLLGAITSFACGAGPTSPTNATPVSQQPTGAPTPAPAPSPAPAPAPTPTPEPTPTPSPEPTPPTAPAPSPTPAPNADSWHGSAETTYSQWMGSAAAPIPASFKVEWTRETLTFGPLTSPVLIWEPKGDVIGIFARPNAMNVQILFNVTTGKGSWTLTSAQGQAAGVLTVER